MHGITRAYRSSSGELVVEPPSAGSLPSTPSAPGSSVGRLGASLDANRVQPLFPRHLRHLASLYEARSRLLHASRFRPLERHLHALLGLAGLQKLNLVTTKPSVEVDLDGGVPVLVPRSSPDA